MPRYTKEIQVEVMQWTGSLRDLDKFQYVADSRSEVYIDKQPDGTFRLFVNVNTSLGRVECELNDYLVYDRHDGLFVFEPDEFNAIHQPVKE